MTPPANNADLAEREERAITVPVSVPEPANNQDQADAPWCDRGSVELHTATSSGIGCTSVTEKDGSPTTGTRIQLSERLEELHVAMSPIGKPAVNELTHREVCITVQCSGRNKL